MAATPSNRSTSFARSRLFPIGIDGEGGAASRSLVLGSPAVRFLGDLPDGTRTVILWEGAGPSRDEFGAPGPLIGPTEDPRELRGAQWARFSVHFLSDPASKEQPSIEEIRAGVSLR